MMIADSQNPKTIQRDHVVFVHGLGGHRLFLWPMTSKIKKLGFSTSTFGYPSWWWSIEHHATRLTTYLSKLEGNSNVRTVHIVAHSMGGIVTRQAMLNTDFEKLGRIVMLGSPNGGSPVARVISNVLPFLKTLKQVSNHDASFVNQMPCPTDKEIGIIAAQYDRVIPEPSSHLPTEADHISIFSGHNGLLIRPKVIRQIGEFLQNGEFVREE